MTREEFWFGVACIAGIVVTLLFAALCAAAV